MPSRLPDRLLPHSGQTQLVLASSGRALRALCEGIFDEFGPLALALEYGIASLLIGVMVWLLFGLVWGIAIGLTVTGGLARRRIR